MFCQRSSLFTLSKFAFTVQCLPASSPSFQMTSPLPPLKVIRAHAFFSIFARGLRQVRLDFFTGSLNLDNTNFVAFWLILVLRMGQETAAFIHKQHTTKAAFYSLRVSSFVSGAFGPDFFCAWVIGFWNSPHILFPVVILHLCAIQSPSPHQHGLADRPANWVVWSQSAKFDMRSCKKKKKTWWISRYFIPLPHSLCVDS